MMIKKFNELILNDQTIDKDSVVVTMLQEDIENSLIFQLSREIYRLVYNAEVQKDPNGGLGIFIDQLYIDDVATHFQEVISSRSATLNIDESKMTNDLMDVVKKYYRSTATEEELKSRMVQVKGEDKQSVAFGKIGTIYDLNNIPDWDEFEKLLRKGIKSFS